MDMYAHTQQHNYILSDFQEVGNTKPTCSDEPLIVVVWDTIAEFGSVFCVPWAIFDNVVTYIRRI